MQRKGTGIIVSFQCWEWLKCYDNIVPLQIKWRKPLLLPHRHTIFNSFFLRSWGLEIGYLINTDFNTHIAGCNQLPLLVIMLSMKNWIGIVKRVTYEVIINEWGCNDCFIKFQQMITLYHNNSLWVTVTKNCVRVCFDICITFAFFLYMSYGFILKLLCQLAF